MHGTSSQWRTEALSGVSNIMAYRGGTPINPKYAIAGVAVGLATLGTLAYIGCPRKPKPAEQKKSYSMDANQQAAQRRAQRQAEENVCEALGEKHFRVDGDYVTLYGRGRYDDKPCSYEMGLQQFCDMYDLCKKKPTAARRPATKAKPTPTPKPIIAEPAKPAPELPKEVVAAPQPEPAVEPPATPRYQVEQPAPPSYQPQRRVVPLSRLRDGTYNFSNDRCPPEQPLHVYRRGNR